MNTDRVNEDGSTIYQVAGHEYCCKLYGACSDNPAAVLYCRDVELACDESVVHGKSTEERKAYSMALLECSAEKFGQKIFSVYNATPIAFGEIGVKKRVVNLFKNKKSAIWVVCAAVIVCAAVAVFLLTDPIDTLVVSNSDSANEMNESVKVSDKVDRAVSRAIFEYNDASPSDVPNDAFSYDLTPFPCSECIGEGHIILDLEETEDELTVYAVYSICGYNFVNDCLVICGDSAATPAIITFDVDGNGNYIYKSNVESLSDIDTVKIFPGDLVEKALIASYDSEIFDELKEQKHEYARAYLKKIGRDAKVGTLEDFGIKSLDEYGVDSDLCDRFMSFFPEYNNVARFEVTENGVRYVYEETWDGDNNGNGIVGFRKYKYGSNNFIENYRYQISGESFTKLEGNKSKYYSELNDDGSLTYFWDDGRTYTDTN